MPKIQVVENASPSETLIKKANQDFSTTDANGRVITLRNPPVLAQFNLVAAVGDRSSNKGYMAMVMPLIYVTSIDGSPVNMPNTQREIDALIQKLDDAGVEAVMNAVMEHFGEQDIEAKKAEIKN